LSTLLLVDFDGTLTRKDSTRWLVSALLSRRPWLIPFILVDLFQLVLARFAKSPDALQQSKCRMTGKLIRNIRPEVLEKCLRSFSVQVERHSRPERMEKLLEHTSQGDRVWIVTASPDFAVQFALKTVGPDQVIGTRYEIRDGRYTGRLASPPCFAGEKVNRVEAQLRKENLNWPEQTEGWADSPSDEPLMSRCTRQIWVDPS
jgi:phosphatidylglycerophosphatase C